MAVLAIYATKTGATAQCIKVLEEEIANCTICDILTEKPDIEQYDSLILGAGVRDGKIYKPIRDFIKKNHPRLLEKKIGYFICNEKPKETEEIFERNIPSDLRQSAICMESFGGYKAYAAPKEGTDQLKGDFRGQNQGLFGEV